MELLLVAQSARMLAQSAARAGLRCLAVDCFTDADTRHFTAQCLAVSPGPSGFDAAQLLAAVNAIAPPNGDSALVYGSGIDNRPGLVECLARGRKLLGNPPETLRQITRPEAFFRLLDELGIPCPETRFAPPRQDGAWLCKPYCGEGGKGVGWFSGNPGLSGEVYYQRWVSGDAYSLLFLADGKDIRSLGFNTQWTARHEPAQPFWFAGCINRAELSAAQRQSVEAYAMMLTSATGLVGLNSLDFVVEGGVCKVLEVNPRPSASMALYDADFERGLLALHIAACLGRLPPPFGQTSPLRALRIVYSPCAIRIPKGFQWPKECADLPLPLAEIAAGQPLCSLLVQAENRQQAKNLVKLIENDLFSGLLGRIPARPSSVTESRRGANLEPTEQRTTMTHPVSVNAHALPIAKYLIANADKLRLNIGGLANGAILIDAGIETLGSLEAGRLIGEICMGGLGTVTLTQGGPFGGWPTMVNVHSTNPVIACLGSQYAGWSLSHGEGKGAFYALGSGPARALAVKIKDGVEVPVEELYKELGYRDASEETVIVLEVDKIPPVELIDKVAKACQLDPSRIHVILTPTSSLAGGMQVVSRVLEVALHKAHSLHFPLENIVDGAASAPVPPPHPKFVQAMGRTNDAILFGGTAHLFVKGEDGAAEKLALELPSSVSKDYGKPFAQIFKDYGYDFFKVDAMLFSPAQVIVTNMDTGNSFHAGQLDEELLERSFGG